MKLLSSLLSSVYSRVKLFVFAMNSTRRYSIFVCFIYGLEKKNSKSEVIFAVCRVPLTSCLTSRLTQYQHAGQYTTDTLSIHQPTHNKSADTLYYQCVRRYTIELICGLTNCVFGFNNCEILLFTLRSIAQCFKNRPLRCFAKCHFKLLCELFLYTPLNIT